MEQNERGDFIERTIFREILVCLFLMQQHSVLLETISNYVYFSLLFLGTLQIFLRTHFYKSIYLRITLLYNAVYKHISKTVILLQSSASFFSVQVLEVL
jgi:hypothetical protein